MRKIFRYLRPHEWALIILCIGIVFAQVWLDLKTPEYMTQMTNLLMTPGTTTSDIWGIGIYMILCSLGSFGTTVIVTLIAARIATGLSFTLRHLQFAAVEGYSMTEINKFSTASLITRSTNDITQVQMIVAMGLALVVRAPIMAVWAIIKIADKEWHWTLATAITVVILLVVLIILMKIVIPRFKRIQGLTDNLNRITEENLTGIRVVRAYNAEGYQTEKFEKANDELTENQLFAFRKMVIMQPMMMLIMNGLTLVVYWIGAYLINAAEMQDKMVLFSDMIVFSSYAMMIVMSFLMLVMIFTMLPRATVAANRICEVIETPSSILDGSETTGINDKKGCIEFKNVSFKYHDGAENVLSNISFTANKGETVAFIGSTGSGKSTLINLIPRFYDATEGEVIVEGRNVKEYKGSALRSLIGYISQKAVMFKGTVRSNIDFGDNFEQGASDEEIGRALKIAQASFVDGMPGGIDADIAQGGHNVSGGQKQRLSIARALARKADIYIFDDSFSALDYKTDKMLRRAINEEMQDATVLIVAQRIGTIKNADKIIVLDEGRIAGMGTHSELMQNCNVYREIAYSQLSKEELA